MAPPCLQMRWTYGELVAAVEMLKVTTSFQLGVPFPFRSTTRGARAIVPVPPLPPPPCLPPPPPVGAPPPLAASADPATTPTTSAATRAPSRTAPAIWDRSFFTVDSTSCWGRRGDSGASAARLTGDPVPWLCVPGSPRVCRFDAGSSLNRTGVGRGRCPDQRTVRPVATARH